jgi:hypothetical protein
LPQQVLTKIQAKTGPRRLGSQLLKLGAPGRQSPFHL